MNLRKASAYMGLTITALTLVATVWAYSASWTRLNDKVELKADKTEIQVIKSDLKIIICILDKSKCNISTWRKSK